MNDLSSDINPVHSTTASAKNIAIQFFDRYRSQQVNDMVALFASEGTVEYVPFNGKGLVTEVGVSSWNGLIDAFPDLTNQVTTVRQNETHRVAFVDVVISGTQVKDAFGISNQGKHYDLRHLFVIEINDEGKILSMVAFWDNADWYRQLGKTTLD